MNEHALSFAPLSRRDARVLVLGSMPGQASLSARQYYAHPRNAFWPIMAELLGLDASASYPQRTRALTAGGVALWDVLAECRRPGSLDAAIDPASVVVNDVAGFLRRHPKLHAIFFNGATAESLFRRHILPTLQTGGLTTRSLTLARLPSTSPAHAALDRAAKLAAWRQVSRACELCEKPVH